MAKTNDPYVIYLPPEHDSPPESGIEPSLIREYRRTVFQVYGQSPFALRVGEYSPELAELYRQLQAHTALYITAYSPYSTVVSGADNQAAEARLADDLIHSALLVIDGDGQDPERQWPAESSLLAVGVNQDKAADLGRQYRQNAVVWTGQDAVPLLLLLR